MDPGSWALRLGHRPISVNVVDSLGIGFVGWGYRYSTIIFRLKHAAHFLIPGSTYVEIEGAAHIANINQADAFNMTIAKFLGL